VHPPRILHVLGRLVAVGAVLALAMAGAPAGAGVVLLCDGLPATIVGTEAPDDLAGGPGPDVIVGLGGDDTLRGEGGNDTICGGDGFDQIEGGNGDDREFGEANSDTFQTSPPTIFHVDIFDSDGNPGDDFGDGQGEFRDDIELPPGTIGDINVRIDVDHSSPSDISIFVTSPFEEKSKMVENTSNFAPGTGFNGTSFDSEAITPIQDPGGADLRGRFHPAHSLDAPYRYKEAGGMWTVNVKDNVVNGINDGVWNWVELEVVYMTDGTDGSDVYDGGEGTQDHIDYTARKHNVNVSLNAIANDGAGALGEVDDATQNSEWIYSGFGKDRLNGNGVFNDLRAGSGNDVIKGFGGNDRFRGGNGNDKEYGHAGNDKLDGNDGNDTLDGGPGTDLCINGETEISCEP